MPTLDDAYLQRWNLINPNIPYNAAFGIPTYWRDHPELGSPAFDEMVLDDGSHVQVFSNGIVRWTEDGGAEVV